MFKKIAQSIISRVVAANEKYDAIEEPFRFLLFFFVAGVLGMGLIAFYPLVGFWFMVALLAFRVPYRIHRDAMGDNC